MLKKTSDSVFFGLMRGKSNSQTSCSILTFTHKYQQSELQFSLKLFLND